jgi:hypothetical protein
MVSQRHLCRMAPHHLPEPLGGGVELGRVVSREAWPSSVSSSTTSAPASRAEVAKVWPRACTKAPAGTRARSPARM